MRQDEMSRVPVVVGGAGPAGLTAAIMLARYGVGSLLVEQRDDLSTLPRATGISTRTMELIRSWGLDGQVRAGEMDVRFEAWLTETLASPTGAAEPLGYPTHEQAAAVSPAAPAAVPQDHLEAVLLDRLRTYPTARIRFGTELVDVDQDDEGVTTVLRDRATGVTSRVRSRFLVAADGAHSTVRTGLGIRMDGPDHLEEIISVLFRAPLGPVLGDRRYGIYMVMHPEASGVFVPSGNDDRWIYAFGWQPDRERLEDYTAARLTELIRTGAGAPDLQPRLVRVGAFSFAAQLAERYRQGRTFLVGDAAHRITPRGGTGMNTAIHDAYNLGWKLAWGLRGWSGEGLLDTYEAERRPVGARNAARSATEASRDVGQYLADDLGGRIGHAWVGRASARVSTIDLLGPGLTLLTGPGGAGWRDLAATVETALPFDVHVLDAPAADAVGIPRRGAVLVRPDGQVVAGWPAAAGDAEGDLSGAVRQATGGGAARPALVAHGAG
jgi:putative polyketide hydroxylase